MNNNKLLLLSNPSTDLIPAMWVNPFKENADEIVSIRFTTATGIEYGPFELYDSTSGVYIIYSDVVYDKSYYFESESRELFEFNHTSYDLISHPLNVTIRFILQFVGVTAKTWEIRPKLTYDPEPPKKEYPLWRRIAGIPAMKITS